MEPTSRSESFDEFFRRLWSPTVRHCARLIGDAGDAEDATAEAFARAYLDWRRVGVLSHRDAWLIRVASNVSIDRVRSRSRQHVRMRRAAEGCEEADATDAVASDLGVAAALRSLPRRQREVVCLRHVWGLSEPEVARALGLSTNSVKTHSARALARLRDRLPRSALEGDLAI